MPSGGGGPAPASNLLQSGAITENSFEVTAEIADAIPGDIQLLVSINSDLSAPIFTSVSTAPTNLSFPSSTTRKWIKIIATGLSADTQYHYGIKDVVADEIQAVKGKCKTTSTPFAASSYKCIVIGDSDVDNDQTTIHGAAGTIPMFTPITANESDALIILDVGDKHYKDDGNTNQPLKRNNLRQSLIAPESKALFSILPVAYMYDDHDAGPNNAHMGTANFNNFMAEHIVAYKQMMPHYPLSQTVPADGWVQCLAHSFVIGRVKYYMPDLKSFASLSNTTLGDGGTHDGNLTWDQKQDLKDRLAADKAAGVKLIVFVSSRGWTGIIHEVWEQKFLAELQEMCTYFGDTDIPELVIIAGDIHQLGADDGTNKSIPFAVNTRVALLQAGPTKHDTLTTGQPYSWNGVLTQNATEKNYSTFEIVDVGGDRVQWIYTGKSITGATLLGPVSNFDVTNEVEQSTPTYAVQESAGTIDIPVIKDWLGNCSVIVNTADGTAIAGTDYTAKTAEVFDLLANRTETVLQITILDRGGAGPASRDFTVTLSSPVECTLGANTASTVTISN